VHNLLDRGSIPGPVTIMKNNFFLSVVIPVFNEKENIFPLLDRLLPAVDKYPHEIIFIDDGSSDATSAAIKTQCRKNKNLKLISLSRNFGHQMALSAGYQAAQGDAVISMDADLQDPPEIIREMVEKWQKGNRIVYAKRKKREVDGMFKKKTAQLFYKFINFLSDTPIPNDVGDFRLLDRTVVDFLNNLPENSRFLRGLVSWPGFESSYVYFAREKRYSGKTHYGFFKMMNFALDGITSFSTKPLRIATYFGVISGFMGFVGIVYEIAKKIIYPESFVTGWIGLFIAVMFLGGIQLITIGIIGEYISKIYKEVQNRPKYLIKEKINL